ncbi:MAG: hypothetical protein ACYC35_01485 [Pirellulales bacterium]
MRYWRVIALFLAAALGCAPVRPFGVLPAPPIAFHANPMLVPAAHREDLWEQIVDVVDDYFQIERESPIHVVGNILTEGQLDTYPLVGSTVFEPWNSDSTPGFERLHSTLQSTRRRAQVRATPTEGGFLVEVFVFKELEDVPRPEHATTGAAVFRNDDSVERYTEPVGGQSPSIGWIPMGRDVSLEQQILSQLAARLGGFGPRALP